MVIKDWIVDGEQTKRISAVFRPRRGLEEKLLQAIDAANKREPCVGFHIIEVPDKWLETTRRRFFNPDNLMKEYSDPNDLIKEEDHQGTTRYGIGNFEYFVRIPLTKEGARANLIDALKREDPENKRVGLKFTTETLAHPERVEEDGRIQLVSYGEHFLTIMKYPGRQDILDVSLARKTTTEETFKARVEKVNQYIGRIFRALDKKGHVRYE
ncbi:hypothetical protein HZA97_03965 [Candidatus Woesearchaeota archaeon]|nr:hypothetical protein [Candidatus Woesearchaeota archaeon]